MLNVRVGVVHCAPHNLGIVRHRRLLQLQNDRSHAAHVSIRFARLWIEITEFGDALPFGAGLNVGRFSYKLLLCISMYRRSDVYSDPSNNSSARAHTQSESERARDKWPNEEKAE